MTRYPRQVDREYLSCRSGGLDKIQMIDGGTLDLHQDLVACDRRRRYIAEHQLPTVFQQSDSFHASSPLVCPFGCAWRRAQSGSFVSARPNSRSRPAMSALSRRARTIAASTPYPCCTAGPVRLASARTQSADPAPPSGSPPPP